MDDQGIKTQKYRKFEEVEQNRDEFNGMDIAFVIDATASMQPYIEQSKKSIEEIIEDAKSQLSALNADESQLKFAVVAYRDHPPEDKTFVTKCKDFTNSENAVTFLKDLKAAGGGDAPEAVIDGLSDAVNNISWRKQAEKFIFHVADAPPHGKEFQPDNLIYSDAFPEGCPCGIDYTAVLKKIRDENINYTILSCKAVVSKMIEVFAQYVNIDEIVLPEEKNYQNGRGGYSARGGRGDFSSRGGGHVSGRGGRGGGRGGMPFKDSSILKGKSNGSDKDREGSRSRSRSWDEIYVEKEKSKKDFSGCLSGKINANLNLYKNKK